MLFLSQQTLYNNCHISRKNIYLFRLIILSRPAKPDISIEEGTEVYFDAGSDVEFTCIVHAYPQAQLQWKKNDTVLVTSNANNTDINDFRMSFSLKLSSVTESGFYTCAGANSQGESEVTVIMNVSRKCCCCCCFCCYLYTAALIPQVNLIDICMESSFCIIF